MGRGVQKRRVARKHTIVSAIREEAHLEQHTQAVVPVDSAIDGKLGQTRRNACDQRHKSIWEVLVRLQ